MELLRTETGKPLGGAGLVVQRSGAQWGLLGVRRLPGPGGAWGSLSEEPSPNADSI